MAEATRQPTSRKRRKAAPAQEPLDYDAMAIELAISFCDNLAADDGHAARLRQAVEAAGRMGTPASAEALLAALRRASATLADVGAELVDAADLDVTR